jgi:hypothetical protein
MKDTATRARQRQEAEAKKMVQRGNDYLRHYYCINDHYNHCWVETVMLDIGFLVYAIREKQDQQSVKWSSQTRNEITVLRVRLLQMLEIEDRNHAAISERE